MFLFWLPFRKDKRSQSNWRATSLELAIKINGPKMGISFYSARLAFILFQHSVSVLFLFYSHLMSTTIFIPRNFAREFSEEEKGACCEWASERYEHTTKFCGTSLSKCLNVGQLLVCSRSSAALYSRTTNFVIESKENKGEEGEFFVKLLAGAC